MIDRGKSDEGASFNPLPSEAVQLVIKDGQGYFPIKGAGTLQYDQTHGTCNGGSFLSGVHAGIFAIYGARARTACDAGMNEYGTGEVSSCDQLQSCYAAGPLTDRSCRKAFTRSWNTCLSPALQRLESAESTHRIASDRGAVCVKGSETH